MKIVLTAMLLSIFSTSIAQVAIINDEDGYTNVRSMPNSESEIVYKVTSNEVFWYGQEDYHSEQVNWITVDIPKNKFSLECGALDNLQGYIHKSKIKPLNTVNQYKGTDFTFKYVIKPFSKGNYIIEIRIDYLIALNALYPWGTDGNLPKTEIDQLIFK